MSCERYEEELIDHALGQAASAALEAHLVACAGCRGRVEEERRLAGTIDGMLSAGLAIDVPATFARAVQARIEANRWRGWRRVAWVSGGLAAAAALALAIGLRATQVRSVDPVARASTAAPTARESISPSPMPTIVTPRVAEARKRPRSLAPPRSEPEILVPPEQQAAVERLLANLGHPASPAAAAIAIEVAVPFEPLPLEVGTLDELRRLPVTDLPRVEPPAPVERLASGGDV
jgi:hypothetical protein